MYIGNMISGYEKPLPEGKAMDAAKNDNQLKQVKASLDITNLKEGMVFKGEIENITGDKVLINLENHLKLPARLQGDVNLTVGDRLLFCVKDNNNSQILIKPLFDSLYSAETQVLEKALDMTGLSLTEKNFSVAKELMEAGMSLDRGNMTKLLSQSMKFPDAPLSTLVSLNKMNVPVNEENIQQFSRYTNYQHQITEDISHAASSMADFSSHLSEASTTDLVSFAKDMIDMFISDMPEDNLYQEVTAMEDTKNEAVLENDKMLQNINENDNEVFQDEITDRNAIPDKNVEANMVRDNLIKNLSQISGLNDKEAYVLIKNLQQSGLSNEVISNLISNSSSKEVFLQNMVNALFENSTNDIPLQQLLTSNEFKNMFSDLIMKSWSLSPENMKNPKEIDELYHRIQTQSKKFEDVLASKGGDSKGFQHNFQNMRQNMSFMEQINHQMIYAQMPLKLSNQNANSELYVYADKRKLLEKKDGISVMLHLDMDHLGQTDVKITLTGSNVHARFYLNDQESVDIVTNNMNDLAKQLGLRGFSLTDEVLKRSKEESINKVIDEIIDENAEKSIKRYTFDARM